MKHFLRFIMGTGLVVALTIVAQARQQTVEEAYQFQIVNSPVQLSPADEQQVKQFVADTYYTLPESVKHQLGPQRFPVTLEFKQLDGNELVPMPACPVIDDMGPARKLREDFKNIAKGFGSGKIRYDGAIHTAVRYDDKAARFFITIHAGFIPSILAPNSSVMAKACNGMTLKQTATASILHGFARAYDLTRFSSKSESDYMNDNNNCGRMRDVQASGGEKMMWNEATLFCLDLHESKTLVSEKKRYRTVTGGWGGKPGAYDKSNFAVWPRAVNSYAFASDVQTHFAYHFEKFIMDPEFACRMPVLHDYLTQYFGDPQNSIALGKCQVNTHIRLMPIHTTPNGNRYVELQEYDLNPNNVETIFYLRAGAGDTGIGGAFGHSMFRLVAKPGSGYIRDGCPDEKYGNNCDVVFNHRATSRELRLENGRAAFGAYPSQLLIGELYDIVQEYGDLELRDVFNIPLGNMQNGKFTPMAEDDKKRLIYAGLEQYWSYMGQYKFITNNCADEAIRLFSMGSLHPGVQHAGVLTPADVNEKVFEKLGFVDPKVMKDLKEPGLFATIISKVRFWDGWVNGPQKRYVKRRKAVKENSETVEESRRYSLYDGISEIFRIENQFRSKDQQRKPGQIKQIKPELERWVRLATVSNKKEDICKINAEVAASGGNANIAENRIQSFRGSYKAVVEPLQAKFDKNQEIEESLYAQVQTSKSWPAIEKFQRARLEYKVLKATYIPDSEEFKAGESKFKVARSEHNEASKQFDKLAKDYIVAWEAKLVAMEDMYDMNHAYYNALHYADKKRQHAIGDLAVAMAYEIGSPDGKRPNLCDGDFKWQIDPIKSEEVHKRVEDYRKLEMQLQPYSANSVARGYGIPMDNEITPGLVFKTLANAQLQRQQELILLLKGELGYDYELWFKIKQFRKDLCEERVAKNLLVDGEDSPNCRIIYPEIYTVEAEMKKAADAKKQP